MYTHSHQRTDRVQDFFAFYIEVCTVFGEGGGDNCLDAKTKDVTPARRHNTTLWVSQPVLLLVLHRTTLKVMTALQAPCYSHQCTNTIQKIEFFLSLMPQLESLLQNNWSALLLLQKHKHQNRQSILTNSHLASSSCKHDTEHQRTFVCGNGQSLPHQRFPSSAPPPPPPPPPFRYNRTSPVIHVSHGIDGAHSKNILASRPLYWNKQAVPSQTPLYQRVKQTTTTNPLKDTKSTSSLTSLTDCITFHL